MRSFLAQLDHAFEVVNMWLFIIAVGLVVLVVMAGIVRLALPAHSPTNWSSW